MRVCACVRGSFQGSLPTAVLAIVPGCLTALALRKQLNTPISASVNARAHTHTHTLAHTTTTVHRSNSDPLPIHPDLSLSQVNTINIAGKEQEQRGYIAGKERLK